jgi:glycosyltransferase involved in cell wall biosynthesis
MKAGLVMSDESKRIKIAFLTSFDPHDKRSWSGTMFCMAQALQKHCGEVSYIAPIRIMEKRIARIFDRSSQLLLKKGFMHHHCFFVAKKYAKVAAQRLAKEPFDVIVAPGGATEIAFLKTDIPIVLVEDATYASLHNYYPTYSNLLGRSVYEMNTIEDLAIKKAGLLIYTSKWSAQSALEDYHADKQKIHIIPFGGNLERPPANEEVKQKRKTNRCRLLFLGVNWDRKGGKIAFETLLKLEEMGIQAELVVCGCMPPSNFSHENMTVIPFLDKNNEEQRKRLDSLYLTSDFLLVPTRADAYGLVFCEASAFGLPAITTNTGGVPEVVRDGENGFTLPYGATGAQYAKVIAQIYRDDQRYAELVRSSRAAFEKRLNWDVWGVTVKQLITDLLDREKSREHPDVALF